jgi:hypothetical protein
MEKKALFVHLIKKYDSTCLSFTRTDQTSSVEFCNKMRFINRHTSANYFSTVMSNPVLVLVLFNK